MRLGTILLVSTTLAACQVNLNTEGLTTREVKTFKVAAQAELVLDAFDSHRRDGRAFNRAEQHPPQAVPDGGAEPALKRLRRKHAIPFREGLGIGDQAFRFLETFEHNKTSQELGARSQELESNRVVRILAPNS